MAAAAKVSTLAANFSFMGGDKAILFCVPQYLFH
jgi:hypothetical protein